MNSVSKKSVLWLLIGFGIATIFYLVVGMTKSGKNVDMTAVCSQQLQGITSELLHVNRGLESMQQQMTARAIKEDELLLALEKVENLMANGSFVLPITPPGQRTLAPGADPQAKSDQQPESIKATSLQENSDITAKSPRTSSPGSIEMRVQPKQPKKAEAPSVQKKAAEPSKPAAAGKSTSAAKPVAPAKTASAKIHTVQTGDTLYSIARTNDVPLARLLEANGLKEGATIGVGQVLKIPK